SKSNVPNRTLWIPGERLCMEAGNPVFGLPGAYHRSPHLASQFGRNQIGNKEFTLWGHAGHCIHVVSAPMCERGRVLLPIGTQKREVTRQILAPVQRWLATGIRKQARPKRKRNMKRFVQLMMIALGCAASSHAVDFGPASIYPVGVKPDAVVAG